MKTKDTGGAAFPMDHQIDPDRDIQWCGMSLRDYFAAKAMQGMSDSGCSNAAIAKCAYQMADEMLKARQA